MYILTRIRKAEGQLIISLDMKGEEFRSYLYTSH